MKNKYGQTALIMILLTAAALIFLAITLNWGRVAQTKSLLSIAADESAALLASEAASYGEAQKQTNLVDQNQLQGPTGTFLDLILLIIAIIVAVVTFGVGTPFLSFIAVASVALAAVNLVLQVVVVQPMISSMWNSLQKDQPIQQQFYEQGVSTALQNSVGDQVNVTDYLDWNENGSFGFNSTGQPNDLVPRYAIFYTDRLRMLNQNPIPAVVFFYNQLSELMNGESCDQNANDVSLFSQYGITENPACTKLDCAADPIDPACEMKIPGGFQLNDACSGSNPNNITTYTPYCDPCCQPQYVPGSSPQKALRPTSGCPAGDGNCSLNNPYGGSYPDIYDSSFQQYSNGLSALDKLGRDQQMPPFNTSITPQGSANNGIYFPNGVFPFFWMMKYYSPQVDNIDPTSGVQPSQYHWCTPSVTGAYTPPTGYADLNQLSLPYTCSGADCCVNKILNNVTTLPSVVSAPIQITLTAGPVVNITSPANGKYFPVGSTHPISATASEPNGTISSIGLYSDGYEFDTCTSSPCQYSSSSTQAGTHTFYATATDANGAVAQSSTVTIYVIDPPAVNVSIGNVVAGSTATITANASTDQSGDSIANVTFYDNGTSLGSVSASPYTYQWTVPASGTSYSITAVATDQHGLSTTSSAIQGTVP